MLLYNTHTCLKCNNPLLFSESLGCALRNSVDIIYFRILVWATFFLHHTTFTIQTVTMNNFHFPNMKTRESKPRAWYFSVMRFLLATETTKRFDCSQAI